MITLWSSKMNYWEKTKKYWPWMANRGYVFRTNIDRDASPEEMVEYKAWCTGQKITLDGKPKITTKGVIVKGFMARYDYGKVEIKGMMMPVFAKFEDYNPDK